MHTVHRATLAAALGAAALTLVGCSNPLDSLAEDGIERLVEEGLEGTSDAEIDLNLDGDGAELPSTWPGSLGEPPGTVVASVGTPDGGVITLQLDSVDDIEAYVQSLESAGFAPATEIDLGPAAALLDDGEWEVIVGWVDEAGEVIATVTYGTSSPSVE